MLSDSQRTAIVDLLLRGRENAVSGIPRRPAGVVDVPQSFGQEQLWFLDGFAPGLPTYNIPHALALSGRLDAGALGRAVDALVARHEALRTRLVAGADGCPVQVVDLPGPVPLGVADLSGLEPADRVAALRELIDAEAVRPFVLAAGPLLRVRLVRLAEGEHVLVVVVHHAVFDGWSAGVLVRELAALYGQEAGCRCSSRITRCGSVTGWPAGCLRSWRVTGGGCLRGSRLCSSPPTARARSWMISTAGSPSA
jgi:hypothetical protein